METQIIKEGKVKLEVPRLEDYRNSKKEYVPSQTPVFFNPVMELTRDISVSSVELLCKEIEGVRICDVLAGLGARGIRYAREVEGTKKVVVNDRDEKAVDFIRKNVELNEISNIEVRNKDANQLLHNHRPRFHVIDIDPFGPPIPFLDSSFSAISRRGVLLITATDTAPLCGAYPNACLRKYNAKPLRTPYNRELGVRIMIGSIQRRATAYDLALTPVLSHATQHYFRTHFQVSQGAKKGDRILKELGYVAHCFSCGRRYWEKGLSINLPDTCECGNELEFAGPLWLGELGDKSHIQEIIEDLADRDFKLEKEERSLLRKISKEVNGPPTFYDIHEICSKLGVSPPKISRIIKNIRKKDYFASRTNFSDNGLRTNAPYQILEKVISK